VYRLLRRPRWVLLTVGTVLAMVVMVNLSLWQLRRLDGRKAENRAVSTRTATAPASLDVVLSATSTLDDLGEAPWRRIEVSGTYDLARQVFVNDRSLDGVAGLHVVTPLVLADGRALLVNRGWVPAPATVDAAPSAPDPPSGLVAVLGRVRPTQTRGWIGPRDPVDGTLTRVSRVDIARIGRQVPYALVPAYIELGRADDGTLPRPLPLPALDDGPHLSYAGQWLLFALLAGAGWVALVRRHLKLARQAARRAERAAAVTIAAPSPGDEDRHASSSGAPTTGPSRTTGA
jgi:surfeit locus 1 family protein